MISVKHGVDGTPRKRSASAAQTSEVCTSSLGEWAGGHDGTDLARAAGITAASSRVSNPQRVSSNEQKAGVGSSLQKASPLHLNNRGETMSPLPRSGSRKIKNNCRNTEHKSISLWQFCIWDNFFFFQGSLAQKLSVRYSDFQQVKGEWALIVGTPV